MIVDLMRNDLGRFCTPGSVVVEHLARPERQTGVWHLVSDVVGELAVGEDDASLLRATYPPGSVTGAPKVRAMGVIHELEATGRETYTGAIGYVSPCAGLELNVAIRTFEFAAGLVWLGVGGGVVIGSTAEGERAETLVKASPLLSAIGAQLDATGETEQEQPRPASGERTPHATAVEVAAARPPVDLEAGVFTTIVVAKGNAFDLHLHLRRLGRQRGRALRRIPACRSGGPSRGAGRHAARPPSAAGHDDPRLRRRRPPCHGAGADDQPAA